MSAYKQGIHSTKLYRFNFSVSIHPSFDNKNIYNDVALLHLTKDFNLDRHIDRICLPPPNDRSVMNGTECRATGWGKDKYGL